MIFLTEPKDFKQKFDVVSCFVEHEGDVLFLHRQDHKPQGNTWGVPAGKVDEGEDLITALVRELSEEIGYTPKATDVNYFNKLYVRYPKYDFTYHIFHHLPSTRPSIILNLEEHKAIAWVTPQQALTMDLIPDEDVCIKLFFKDRLE
jgi:8-oxo-dGTP pyrophosphatase MutT (NUDIX family)